MPDSALVEQFDQAIDALLSGGVAPSELLSSHHEFFTPKECG